MEIKYNKENKEGAYMLEKKRIRSSFADWKELNEKSGYNSYKNLLDNLIHYKYTDYFKIKWN